MVSTMVTAVLPSSGNWNTLARSQLDILQSLVRKHLQEPSLTEIASGSDFSVTTTERGIPRYEHSHLVAALDVLLEYQRNRKTTYFKIMGTRAQTSLAPYRHDPRTRLIELLKRWLRSNAANAAISEEEVRRMCGLCRDLLNYPNLFPSRNRTSFMHALSEVYEHLELQLRLVLERDRTCAELAARCLSLSRNLVSDAIAFLLLAETHLTQTDLLPSLEVVVLWQSLPAGGKPLPSRADPQLQKTMQDAWGSRVGSLIAALLRLKWTGQLFASAQEMAPGPAGEDGVVEQLQHAREDFAMSRFKHSGLAGPFREASQEEPRENLLIAIESLYDLLYLLGEVLSHFHRISDSLGDYGMIRVSSWLHPCVDSMIEKVQRLQSSLKGLSRAVDAELVIAKARGRTIKKPLPSERMSARAHAAVERALVGQDCHLTALLQSLEELKTRSSPERLPHVVEGLGDACAQLQNVLTSPQFRARVGDAFPQRLPSLANISRPQRTLEIVDVEAEYSEPEELTTRTVPLPERSAEEEVESPAEHCAGHSPCFFLFNQAAQVGDRRRSSSLSRAVRATFRAFREPAWHNFLPASSLSPAALPEPRGKAPDDLVSELPADGWMSHTSKGGRTSWHHRSLGPAPWEGRDELEAAAVDSPPVAPLVKDTNPFSVDLQATSGQPQPWFEGAWGDREPPVTFEHGPRSLDPSLATPTSVSPESPQMATDTARPLREADRASTWPDFLQRGCLRAEVQRLTGGMQGWKTHDTRSLMITGSQLLIYDKGSIDHVKTVVNLQEDVERCSLLDGLLFLEVRRRRRSSSLSRFTPRKGRETREKKLYIFKFEPQELADQFRDIICSEGLPH